MYFSRVNGAASVGALASERFVPAPGQGSSKDRSECCVVADNVLDRQFQANASNQKRVAEFTYI